MMKKLMKHKFTIVFLITIGIMGVISWPLAVKAISLSTNNIITMMGVIPPIFVLIGLLDVWVPKETMIKYMGEESGTKGLLFAVLLGSLAAGPLYVAFPVAGLLLKKGARFAYVIFFLSTWTVAKIPLVLFEITSLGMKFTLIHVVSMMVMYLVGAFYIERILHPHEKKAIIKNIESM